MPAFPAQLVSVSQELGSHIMGAVVVAWVAELALERGGEGWLEGGWISLRFRRHLEEGLLLSVLTEEQATELAVEVVDEEGRCCSDARLGLGWPTDLELGGAQEQPPAASPLGVDELAPGTPYGSLALDFDAARDQAFLRQLPFEDPWLERGLAHPAWLLSAANGLMRRALALPLPNSAQAGVRITSLAPVESGARLELDGRLLERFDRGKRRFLVSRLVVRSEGSVAAVLDLTSCYW